MTRKSKSTPHAVVETAQPAELAEAMETVEAAQPQEAAAAPTRKAVKTKRTGVGAFVVETIKANIENKVAMTNDQILQMVKDKFGDEVKTTKACIAWYQSKVRGEYI